MKMKPVLGILVALVVVVSLPAYAAAVTTSDFLIEIAKMKNVDAGNGQAATAALAGAGFELPALALDKPLTEADVVAISAAVGLRVSTSRPEAPFTGEQLDIYVAVFGSSGPGAGPEVAPNDGPANPDPPSGVDPLTKGKGKKKGISRSPSDPIDY